MKTVPDTVIPSVGKTDINTGDKFILDRKTGTIVIENANKTKNSGTTYIPDGRSGTPQQTFEGLQSGVQNKQKPN